MGHVRLFWLGCYHMPSYCKPWYHLVSHYIWVSSWYFQTTYSSQVKPTYLRVSSSLPPYVCYNCELPAMVCHNCWLPGGWPWWVGFTLLVCPCSHWLGYYRMPGCCTPQKITHNGEIMSVHHHFIYETSKLGFDKIGYCGGQGWKLTHEINFNLFGSNTALLYKKPKFNINFLRTVHCTKDLYITQLRDIIKVCKLYVKHFSHYDYR
jgi:hypothetical protein